MPRRYVWRLAGVDGGRSRVGHRVAVRLVWFVLSTGAPRGGCPSRTRMLWRRRDDRRKKGTNHAVMVDRHSVPLVIRTGGTKVSDHKQVIPPVLDFPSVGGEPGRSKELPNAFTATEVR